MQYGEIDPSLIPPAIEDGFIVRDEPRGRAFYVPDMITVYNTKGEAFAGEFRFDPGTGTAVEVTANVSPSARLGARNIVGAGTRIGPRVVAGVGVTIEDRVWIWADAIIGNKVIIGRKSNILSGATVSDRVIVGSRSVVEEGVTIPRGATLPPASTISQDSEFPDTYFK